MNGVQTRFKCKLDVKRCKRFVFPPSSLLPRSNALKTKAIRYFQTDRTLTRIVSPPLQEEFDKPYFERLVSFVKSEYGRANVLPPGHLIFHVFNSCPFEKVKVVILGQDPYPNPGQYYGICFSVPEGVAIPGSLANIFKEIHRDLGKPIPTSGNLDRWVAQGVFSMNSVLTVRAHETGSHRNMGWETFTDAVIKKLSDEREHLVFMLWGAYAKEKAALIDSSKHLILTTVHPSPRSAEYGFFGCRHFSKANDYLRSKGIEEIDW